MFWSKIVIESGKKLKKLMVLVLVRLVGPAAWGL